MWGFHVCVLKDFTVTAQSLNKPQSEKLCFCLSPSYRLLKMTQLFAESGRCRGRGGCSPPWREDTQLRRGRSTRRLCLATDLCQKSAQKKRAVKYPELLVSCPRVQRVVTGATQTSSSISFLTFGAGSAPPKSRCKSPRRSTTSTWQMPAPCPGLFW